MALSFVIKHITRNHLVEIYEEGKKTMNLTMQSSLGMNACLYSLQHAEIVARPYYTSLIEIGANLVTARHMKNHYCCRFAH